jgi:transposase
VVGRKNYYGSGSPAAATAAGRIWSVTATASRAGWNPLTHLCAYLEACARNGGRPLEGEALDAFLPWSATDGDAERYKGPLEPAGPAP